MRPGYRRFTDEERAKVKAFFEQPHSVKEFARSIGRNANSVSSLAHQMRKKGLIKPPGAKADA